MPPSREACEIRCPACSWSEVCGPREVARWLVQARKARAGREPEWDVMVEVFRATGPALTCPRCGAQGLAVGPPREDEEDWPEVTCARCSRPIPKERLEALPGATRCAACQRVEESGGEPGSREYCPKCGSPMVLRLARSSGTARYVMVCTGNPPCRRG